MCPELPHSDSPQGSAARLPRQCGVGLISAIALIVLIAVIAAAMARLVQENSATDTASLVRARTLGAAESGLELAMNRVYAPVGSPSCSNRNFVFSVNGLRGCNAITTCASAVAAGQTYYDVSSRGVCADGAVNSSRTVIARAMAP